MISTITLADNLKDKLLKRGLAYMSHSLFWHISLFVEVQELTPISCLLHAPLGSYMAHLLIKAKDIL